MAHCRLSTPFQILIIPLLACAACTQAPPPDPARRATIPEPAGAAPADSAAGTAPADTANLEARRYACDDDSAISVEYVAETARVELPDRRIVVLPKAQSASKGGGDVFVGEAMSLQRDGDAIELHQDEGAKLHCRLAESTE